ncbi:MAG: hypothetical protein JRH20_04345 [Deltaproteobacteria bacterium]|nr:hypothetical protein [Deltaproteobacteria bacterium]
MVDPDVSLVVGDTPLFSRTIAPEVFGSFQEEHWGDLISGIYEQYLINPSFVKDWYVKEGEQKTRLLFVDQAPTPNVAFPWERLPNDLNATYLVAATDPLNPPNSQRIVLSSEGRGGVVQTLALPDRRVTSYDVKIWIRATGDVKVRLAFLEAPGGSDTILDGVVVSGISSAWSSVEAVLTLPAPQSTTYRYRFGVCRFAVIVEGRGEVHIDQATLIPTDAVEGMFNPETIANLSRFKQTMIRWPGGNFTSGYHWQDGIGPMEERPSRPNLAWGGISDNHFGTDEFLRFCELTGITPLVSPGFDATEISTQEIADWVEYANGNTSTVMGALRAGNGRPEPYNVKFWVVGNETYGGYQQGHTDVATYASGLRERIAAMKSVSPDISIAAVGYGMHNTYHDPANEWTQTLLELAGDVIDSVDIHAYVYGPKTTPADMDASTINRAFLASAETFQRFYDDFRSTRATIDSGDMISLVHYEWATLPSSLSDQSPMRETWLNALITATHYNVMLRNGDLVRGGALHNFSVYLNPVRAHSEPPNPRTYVSALFSELAGESVLQTQLKTPTYQVTDDLRGIGPHADVGEVDAIAVQRKDGTKDVVLVNRNLSRTFLVQVCFQSDLSGKTATITTLDSAEPYHRYDWNSTGDAVSTKTANVTLDSCGLAVEAPPLSVTHVSIP